MNDRMILVSHFLRQKSIINDAEASWLFELEQFYTIVNCYNSLEDFPYS